MSSTRPSDQELSGMTVNERLVVCGVIDKWDAAAKRRNKGDMIAILRDVALTETQAIDTVEAVIQTPKAYGL